MIYEVGKAQSVCQGFLSKHESHPAGPRPVLRDGHRRTIEEHGEIDPPDQFQFNSCRSVSFCNMARTFRNWSWPAWIWRIVGVRREGVDFLPIECEGSEEELSGRGAGNGPGSRRLRARRLRACPIRYDSRPSPLGCLSIRSARAERFCNQSSSALRKFSMRDWNLESNRMDAWTLLKWASSLRMSRSQQTNRKTSRSPPLLYGLSWSAM